MDLLHTVTASTLALNVSNTLKERESEALSITVTTSTDSANLVQRAGTTILLHLRKVESTVHSARKLGRIDGESHFLTSQLEHVIFLLVGVEEVDTWAQR